MSGWVLVQFILITFVNYSHDSKLTVADHFSPEFLERCEQQAVHVKSLVTAIVTSHSVFCVCVCVCDFCYVQQCMRAVALSSMSYKLLSKDTLHPTRSRLGNDMPLVMWQRQIQSLFPWYCLLVPVKFRSQRDICFANPHQRSVPSWMLLWNMVRSWIAKHITDLAGLHTCPVSWRINAPQRNFIPLEGPWVKLMFWFPLYQLLSAFCSSRVGGVNCG